MSTVLTASPPPVYRSPMLVDEGDVSEERSEQAEGKKNDSQEPPVGETDATKLEDATGWIVKVQEVCLLNACLSNRR